MSLSRSHLLMRRAFPLVSSLFAATLIAALPAAAQSPAQSHATDGFASSAQPIAADSEAALASAASASAARQAGGQSYQSYGSHSGGFTSHLTFEGGGGANAPIGNDTPFITWGGNVTAGVGYRFNPHISTFIEYQFIDDKLPGGLIADAGAQGGDAHIWSFTLDPVLDFFPRRRNDIYLTGGGGFYRKLTSFTDPEETYICTYFCYPGVENVVVSHFSSNQGGANIGLGLTHKLGDSSTGSDGRLKIFAEARYLWIDTPQIGTTNGLGHTELVPVTAGLRW
jgi:hypothetical protein